MRFGSVCSGIEAASVAWGSLGWEAAWLSEIEPFPCSLLSEHYPNVPNLGDMTKIKDYLKMGVVEAPDVFVGGTPCQAFSVAGLRGGLDDPRGGLTLEFIKIANEIDIKREENGEQPSIIVWENVPGVLSSKDNAFGAFLGGLCGEECALEPSGKKWTNSGCVYGPQRAVAWRILDAQYFGVAQRRKRVFVVASARDIDPSEILFEFDGLRRDTPPSREAWKDVTRSVGGSSAFKDTPILNDQGGSVMSVEDGLVGTLRRETHGHEPIVFSVIADPTPNIGEDICLTLRSQGGGGIVPPSVVRSAEIDDVAGSLLARDYKGFGNQDITTGRGLVITYPIHDKATRHGSGYNGGGSENIITWWNGDDIAATLTKEGAGGNQRMPDKGNFGAVISTTVTYPAYALAGSMIGRKDHNDPNGSGHYYECAPTQTVCDRHAVAFAQNTRDEVREMVIVGALSAYPGMKQTSYIREEMQVRRLTPTEYERLQGFPDSYTLISHRGKPAADGPRYKALGNSMAVPVMAWIGQRIAGAIK